MSRGSRGSSRRRSWLLRSGVALPALSILGAVLGPEAAAQPKLAPFYIEPPKMNAKLCAARKTFPRRAFDWSAWREGPLPSDVSGEEVLAVAEQFASGVGPFAQDLEQAKRLLRYVAEGDLPDGAGKARVRLSQLIIADLNQPRDERERAVTALREDAARGIPEALQSLGRAYELGRFGEVDHAKAFEHFTKAALL
jgi:hypothetical protein